MSAPRSLRSRMMILFCAIVGGLLTVSFAGFYFMFENVLKEQLDRRLEETAAPIIADLTADPEEKDVDQLNIRDQYFEVLDEGGRVAQRSRNLAAALPLSAAPAFQTIVVPGVGRIRAGAVPFDAGNRRWQLVVGASTRDVDAALATLRHSVLILFPVSLLITAAISSVYVARSLAPVVSLTRHAAEMVDRLAPAGSGSTTIPGSGGDELHELAMTFNRLFDRLETVIGQLRQFVSDASHELRTPLSILRGETELLLARERSTAEYEAAMRIIEAELRKLSHIVDGLFTLSMADAGQLRIAPEPLYLEEILEETCALAAPLASSKQIEIQRDLQSDVLFKGDAAFLRQLFLIFIDNAIKYSPSGTRLNVSLAADREVRIRFQDQGLGIAREYLPRIFERFFRVSQSGSGETQSGGLGLSIAQAIVKAHHGTIECESEPGLGSVFTLRFPILASETPGLAALHPGLFS
jgi:signal transduction histidine kinase